MIIAILIVAACIIVGTVLNIVNSDILEKDILDISDDVIGFVFKFFSRNSDMLIIAAILSIAISSWKWVSITVGGSICYYILKFILKTKGKYILLYLKGKLHSVKKPFRCIPKVRIFNGDISIIKFPSENELAIRPLKKSFDIVFIKDRDKWLYIGDVTDGHISNMKRKLCRSQEIQLNKWLHSRQGN